jgi:hypothetical protein
MDAKVFTMLSKTQSKYLKIPIGLFLLVSLAFFAFDKDKLVKDNEANDDKLISTLDSSPELKDKPLTNSLAEARHHENSSDVDKERPFFGKEVKARLIQVTDSFAEDIRFPTFSQPIRNQSELEKYLPNRSFASSIDINLDDANALASDNTQAPRISLKPSKHKYSKGEKILAEAIASGLDTGHSSSVSARLVLDKKVIANLSGVTRVESTSNERSHQYNIVFDALSDNGLGIDSAMMVVAEFNIEGEIFEIGTPIEYVNTVAALDHVGASEVSGEYLQIPVHIKTSEPGFHRVTGNLYDAKTGRALVHLSAKKNLGSEHDNILLQAHIVSLKLMGYEGPYELRDVSLIRMPSSPKYITKQGLVEVERFLVAGFPFSEYEDIAYVDEKAQARLDFLTQLESND